MRTSHALIDVDSHDASGDRALLVYPFTDFSALSSGSPNHAASSATPSASTAARSRDGYAQYHRTEHNQARSRGPEAADSNSGVVVLLGSWC
jgi:hypothetical protein